MEYRNLFLNFGSLKQIQTDSNGHSYWSLPHCLTDSVTLWHIGLKAHTKGRFPLCQSHFTFMHYLYVLHSALTVHVRTSLTGYGEDLCAHLSRYMQGAHFVK